MKVVWTICITLAVLFVIFAIVYPILIHAATVNYTNTKVHPGVTYQRANHRSYTVPQMSTNRSGYLLKEKYEAEMRVLLNTTQQFLKSQNIECWVSGGTLLGFVRHKTFIPWDDDIDVHVSLEHKDLVLSERFQNVANQFGLVRLTRKSLTRNSANRYDSCIKFYLKKHTKDTLRHPFLDLFFVSVTANQVQKVDGWKQEEYILNSRECWTREEIFPLQTFTDYELTVNVPHQPVKVVQKQYAKDVLERAYIPHIFEAHALSTIFNPYSSSLSIS